MYAMAKYDDFSFVTQYIWTADFEKRLFEDNFDKIIEKFGYKYFGRRRAK